MASSSSPSIFNHNNNNNNQVFLKYSEQENGSKVSEQEIEEDEDDGQEEEEEEKGDDLLKLKLGLGSNGEESSPNPGGPSRSGSSLGLGLGLGLKLWPNMEEQGEEEGSEMVGLELGTRRRYIGRLLPSSSSEDWYNHTARQLVLPAHHSHHYHSGLWFTLHSSTNQRGEALPQVPKAYIRVKNEDMTIFMVKKYLVTKLGLFNENEVEIICMGERLKNEERLKMVRDNIWIPSLIHSLNYSSSSQISPNLMPLLYQKHTCP